MTPILFLLMILSPEQEIRALLAKQSADWNRGDVRSFMEGYEKTPDLTFVGASVTRGHAEVLANYIKRYPSQDAMGQLKFDIVEVRPLGADHTCVLGKWHLTRTAAGGGDTGGMFTLIFHKGGAGWKIIWDHTSSQPVK